ncbi:MAG: MoaD/ThiS family protein [Candidatus Lokiarchaeota archaeon]
MVEILYFAEFKSITNKEKEKISLKDTNLMGLINYLIEKYPKMKSIIWDNNTKGLSDEISIAINHNIVSKKERSTIELSDDDVIALLMPVSGG